MVLCVFCIIMSSSWVFDEKGCFAEEVYHLTRNRPYICNGEDAQIALYHCFGIYRIRNTVPIVIEAKLLTVELT